MGDEVPKPASALLLEGPANDSWNVAVWALSASSKALKITAMPAMSVWKGPDNWTITFPTDSGTVRLSREEGEVAVKAGGKTPLAQLTLARPTDIGEKIRDIQLAKERTRNEYPLRRVGDSVEYRYKATYFVLALLVLQELFFAVYKRFTSNRYVLLRGLSTVAWIVIGIWLVVRVPLI
jgi:hypothetical protein